MSEFLIADTKEITLVTIKNIPNNLCLISKILKIFMEEDVETDFFTKQIPINKMIYISFTLEDKDINKLFKILKKIKLLIPGISTEVSGNNAKVIFKTNSKNKFYLLSVIFDIASNMKINIHIVNYSDSEISLLLPMESITEFRKILAGAIWSRSWFFNHIFLKNKIFCNWFIHSMYDKIKKMKGVLIYENCNF